MSWSRAFHVPITTPDGLMLRTLRDAGEYMQALPRAKLKQPEWEIAAETLLAAVEGSGPLMFAEIAMRKALKARYLFRRVLLIIRCSGVSLIWTP
jgi:hypothetical protein